MTTQTIDKKMATATRGLDWYLSNFDALEASLNGEASADVHQLRKAAIARFAEIGFPTTKDEEWKYTDVSPLTRIRFSPVDRSSVPDLTSREIERFFFGVTASHRIVFVNGHFSRRLSSIEMNSHGLQVSSLGDVLRNGFGLVERHLAKYAKFELDPFVALSTAFVQDGVFIRIPDGVILEDPIQIFFISTTSDQEYVSHPRNLILVGRDAQVAIVETYAGLGTNAYFTNTVSEIVLGENAIVEHDRLQLEGDSAFHVSTIQVQQERSSNFRSNAMTFGARLVRNNVNIVLDGEGSECTLNGLYLGIDSQLIDNHTAIDHAKPHCPSHELYKGILSGKARGVFNGKIKVRKDAQKTDAKQTNKNLVLSDEAGIDTKPQLEIYANDVKCTHGATIGQLDDESMFYLRSRGIGKEQARDILIYAFASDVIDRIKIEPLREHLHHMIHDRLEEERQKG